MLPFDPSTVAKDDMEGIGVGLSSIVLHVKDTNSVVKTFPPLDKDQYAERRIYEHLHVTAVTPTYSNTLKGVRLNMSGGRV